MNDNNKITQAELDAVYEELKTPYKYGVVVSGTDDEGTTNVDCQGVFRYNIAPPIKPCHNSYGFNDKSL